jgi:hypothetical protein
VRAGYCPQSPIFAHILTAQGDAATTLPHDRRGSSPALKSSDLQDR